MPLLTMPTRRRPNPLDCMFLFCSYAFLAKEFSMDNRLNRIRKEISLLRVEMLRAEEVVRNQVNHDQDCTEAALRLMDMRATMRALVREWTLLGGLAHLPSVEERLKEKRWPSTKARARSAWPPGCTRERAPRGREPCRTNR